MGWKVSSIIISPKTDIEFENLLEEIGFTNLKGIGEQPFDAVIYPEPRKISKFKFLPGCQFGKIGSLKTSTIGPVPNLPDKIEKKQITIQLI